LFGKISRLRSKGAKKVGKMLKIARLMYWKNLDRDCQNVFSRKVMTQKSFDASQPDQKS
jgi:hypothetical protein